jgi:hypothetical protein
MGYLINKNDFEGHADVNIGSNKVPEKVTDPKKFNEANLQSHNATVNNNASEEFPNT